MKPSTHKTKTSTTQKRARQRKEPVGECVSTKLFWMNRVQYEIDEIKLKQRVHNIYRLYYIDNTVFPTSPESQRVRIEGNFKTKGDAATHAIEWSNRL